MLFKSLYFEFAVVMEHVFPEVVLVLVQGVTVVSLRKVRRQQFIVIFQVHEFRINLVQHLLVVFLL